MMRLFPAPVSPTKLTLMELSVLSAVSYIRMKFASLRSTVMGDCVVVQMSSHWNDIKTTTTTTISETTFSEMRTEKWLSENRDIFSKVKIFVLNCLYIG
jgi:hypothetical protein